MNTLTVNYADAVITVRRARVIDNLNLTRLAVKCAGWVVDDAALDAIVMEWLYIATRTESIEGFDYTLPEIANEPHEIKANFDEFLALDGELVERWTEAIKQVNQPFNKATYAPPVEGVAIAPNS